MTQNTTPTFVLTLPSSVDLSTAANVYFTLEQDGDVLVTKTDEDMTISGNVVSVYLTQADTDRIEQGRAGLQLNWTYSGGSRACTNIVYCNVKRNMLRQVLA